MSQKIAIIILNWNRAQDTAECLNSLKQCTYPNFEVLLVDNGSSDGSWQKLQQQFPNIKFILNSDNLGFVLGNNIGIKEAFKSNFDQVLLLNNDTIVQPDLIDKLVELSEKDASVGIVAPKIMFYSEPERIWSIGGRYLAILRKPDQAFYHEIDHGQQLKEKDLQWVSGCCMLIKREVFDKIGYLDPDYWGSLEDVDFCWRAKRVGYNILVVPQSKIYHKFAVTFGGKHSPFYAYFRVRNLFVFLRKTKQWRPLMINLVIFPVYSVITSVRGRHWQSIMATLIATRDFLIGKYGFGSAGEFR